MSCKSVTVLGSTGSIGKSTVDLLKFHSDKFKVEALTANKNAELLIEQAIFLKPKLVAIGNESLFAHVQAALSSYPTKVVAGEEGILEAASMPVDISIAAIVGMSGLKSAMTTLGNAKILAIANKEPLVAAGKLFLDLARNKGTRVLPLDSEHNAIFQVFENSNRDAISKLILTASGGPFRTWSYSEMEKATLEQALRHPNWSMGSKITIDSATLMNKALEIIEASYLFEMPWNKIDVLIHPQSTVHSMVEYCDGSVLAQLGAADMRTPIAYALAWPERIDTSGEKLDWTKLHNLEFFPADFNKFPALQMAYDCLKGDSYLPVAFNAANEIAVEAFLNRQIGFNDILRIVRKSMESQKLVSIHTLDDVINVDMAVRERTKSYII